MKQFRYEKPFPLENGSTLQQLLPAVPQQQLQALLRDLRRSQPEISVLDLKAQCRGSKYVEETIKLLPEKPEPDLLERIVTKVVGIGRIHAVNPDPISA